MSEKIGEIEKFKQMILKKHRKIDPCFMTGRACVYSEIIDKIWQSDKNKSYSGFMIIPFRPNINMYFNNCLKPFIESTTNYDIPINTANQVRRPGVIICEGICKKIQESDFVVVDISLPNSNVFYELGMAFGLNQKIIVMYKQDDRSKYQKEIIKCLTDINCSKPLVYDNLDPLTLEKNENDGRQIYLSEYIWHNEPIKENIMDDLKLYLYDKDATFLDDYLEPESNESEMATAAKSQSKKIKTGDIDLTFEQQVRSAVGIAVNKIFKSVSDGKSINEKYLEKVDVLKTAHNISLDTSRDIKDYIDKSYCFIVRTGGKKCHPMAYFWLGYCHAIGKNVIPITCIRESNSPIDDLAFDIRAQRHITFVETKPELLEPEIFETLRLMINTDFKEWSRRKFWNKIIGTGGEISIFAGALHSDQHDREMIGDWDLLTVSELTAYFGRHQYRFKIDTPVYPPETGYQNDSLKGEYIDRLRKMLNDKNCIIIASPDVNPLTEIVLGSFYNISDMDLFRNLPSKNNQRPLIAYKGRAKKIVKPEENPMIEKQDKYGRAFYKEDFISEVKTGFILGDQKISATPPKYSEPMPGVFTVFANLFILRNPFPLEDTAEKYNDKYIILLNGVGGPATYALTHVLTGGVSQEFTAYGSDFDPQKQSESILMDILKYIKNDKTYMECVIEVKIEKDKADSTDAKRIKTSDWRKIIKWQIMEKTFDGVPIRSR